MRKLFYTLLLCGPCMLMAQTADKPAGDNVFLWKNPVQKTIAGSGKYYEIQPDTTAINALYFSNKETIQLPLSYGSAPALQATLTLIPMENVRVKVNNASYIQGIFMPKLYRGKISSISGKHDVLLTIAPGYFSLTAHLPDITIQAQKGTQGQPCTLSSSKELIMPRTQMNCGMGAPPAGIFTGTNTATAAQRSTASYIDKCIFVFVDCTDSLYMQHNRSVQETINYVYRIWSGVRTAYENEQLNVRISEVNVWTTPTPFNTTLPGSSTTIANRSFADYYKDNYWGNMAMLLDWCQLNGGIAGGYGWVKSLSPNTCGNYDNTPSPDYNFGSFIYCNLNFIGRYDNFPIPDVGMETYMCTHEIGHLLKSSHTQFCGWNLGGGNYGAIDNCVAMEGNGCSPNAVAGTTPANGGTFMSYCFDRPDIGLNFLAGFGPLPGNVIRTFVNNANCLSNCTTCQANVPVGSLSNAGFQHYEAAVQVTANGTISGSNTFIKLDGGVKVVLKPGFKALAGSKVQAYIDGCAGIR